MTFVNVNYNKAIFSADDRVLLKLLRQKKVYGAKRFSRISQQSVDTVRIRLVYCIVVYLCNAMLVTEIFCFRYSTINNCAKKQYLSTKYGGHFSNLLWIKCTKLYLDSFGFAISILQCLGVYFLLDTV